jgi:pseudouridine synthase
VEATGLSRRKAFAAIREGRLTVDGSVVREPSLTYSAGRLALDGRKLDFETGERLYLLMNKPAGTISATSDSRGRPTVLDVVPVELRLPGLHPVGRLDLDTTGLLLLTNDGSLTYRLTHPSHEVEKEYWLRSKPPLADSALERLRRGVEIDGQIRRPVEARRLADGSGFEASITIVEGRKRQVRRMIEAVGGRVTALRRVREGPLGLGNLAPGATRPLTAAELQALRSA